MLTRNKSEYEELLQHIEEMKLEGFRVNEYLLAQLDLLKQQIDIEEAEAK